MNHSKRLPFRSKQPQLSWLFVTGIVTLVGSLFVVLELISVPSRLSSQASVMPPTSYDSYADATDSLHSVDLILEPSQSTVHTGDNIEVEVKIRNRQALPINGLQIFPITDPNYFNIIEITPNPLFNQATWQSIFQEIYNKRQARLVFINHSQGVTQDELLVAKLKLKALKPGTGRLWLDKDLKGNLSNKVTAYRITSDINLQGTESTSIVINNRPAVPTYSPPAN